MHWGQDDFVPPPVHLQATMRALEARGIDVDDMDACLRAVRPSRRPASLEPRQGAQQLAVALGELEVPPPARGRLKPGCRRCQQPGHRGAGQDELIDLGRAGAVVLADVTHLARVQRQKLRTGDRLQAEELALRCGARDGTLRPPGRAAADP